MWFAGKSVDIGQEDGRRCDERDKCMVKFQSLFVEKLTDGLKEWGHSKYGSAVRRAWDGYV